MSKRRKDQALRLAACAAASCPSLDKVKVRHRRVNIENKKVL